MTHSSLSSLLFEPTEQKKKEGVRGTKRFVDIWDRDNFRPCRILKSNIFAFLTLRRKGRLKIIGCNSKLEFEDRYRISTYHQLTSHCDMEKIEILFGCAFFAPQKWYPKRPAKKSPLDSRVWRERKNEIKINPLGFAFCASSLNPGLAALSWVGCGGERCASQNNWVTVMERREEETQTICSFSRMQQNEARIEGLENEDN